MKKYKFNDLNRDYLDKRKALPDDVNDFLEAMGRKKFPNQTLLPSVFKDSRIGKWWGNYNIYETLKLGKQSMPIIPCIFIFKQGVCVHAKITNYHVNEDTGLLESSFESVIRSEDVDFEKLKNKNKERQLIKTPQ